jgi:hypothetical protein
MRDTPNGGEEEAINGTRLFFGITEYAERLTDAAHEWLKSF